ncbi:hypothetical protein CDL15_Pgr016818 [Punica granatum]|uniref:Uncharacterized protein n=1 Tax=Punica granatum TaxID=22663 RepID=A0A218WYV4_PUNGR|nr:hypothetical protein CDL15_Pgr016818 [Punica granatum]
MNGFQPGIITLPRKEEKKEKNGNEAFIRRGGNAEEVTRVACRKLGVHGVAGGMQRIVGVVSILSGGES